MKNLLLLILIICAGYGCDSTNADMIETTDQISTHPKKIEIISQDGNTYHLRANMPSPYNYQHLWATDYKTYPDKRQEYGKEVVITIQKDVTIVVFGHREDGIGEPLRSNAIKLIYR